MNKSIDITNKRYGKLVAIEKIFIDKKRSYWLCKCDCGNEKIIQFGSLNSGDTRSCGCLQRAALRAANVSHGLSSTRQYRIWLGVKSRCKSNPSYIGKNIIVCEEWKNNFKKFYDWSIANGYKENLHIDRINNNGNYEPGNCRWVTQKQNNRNKGNHRIVEIYGEKLILVEAVEKYAPHLTYHKVKDRLNTLEWNIYKALDLPI